MMRPGVFWIVAAVLMAAITLIHLFGGGEEYVPALLAQTALDAGQTGIYYYVWHMASLTMGASALVFAGAAVRPDWRIAGGVMSCLILAFAVLNLVVGLRFGQFPWAFPQWLMFGLAGMAGVLSMTLSLVRRTHSA